MKWRKGGLVYAPRGDLWWARSYATVPTAYVLDDSVIRVYFAALDEQRFGRIGYVDLDARDPSRILFETPEPVLDLGELGSFSDSGVNPSCVLDVQGKRHLYYIGWQRAERVPYMLFTGLAVSLDAGRTYQQSSRVPVLDRTDAEPFLRSAPSILQEDDLFRAWYVSGLKWIHARGAQYPSYVIRYAESHDAVTWQSGGPVCIDFQDDDEFGFGRPWVVRDAGAYRMWYSIRSHSRPYRIGYAESPDGRTWERLDHLAGISSSETGWDSEMICYPCVVDARGKRYMFHNGNRHGATGFGYATLDN